VNKHIFYPIFVENQFVNDKAVSKRDVRGAVKRAAVLRDQHLIDEDFFKILVELAMAWEISKDLDEKICRKEKCLDQKLR
jgi:hypothetical protein